MLRCSRPRMTQTAASPLWNWIRKVTKPIRKASVGEPYQPFGPDFGLTIIPNYLTEHDQHLLKRQYIDLMTRKSPDIVASDGRIQLPPFNPDSFAPVIDRLVEDKLVLPGHLNNQTVNFFEENSFIRAHIDNLFIYDDTFVILSLLSPALLRFVHIQNGEELECLIPPNSVYIMEGPSRYVYMHFVPPNELMRVSIVLRRSIFRSSGTFAPVTQRMQNMLPYKANAALEALLSKQIGVPRIIVDEQWMAQNNLGAFDTGEMVRRLHPMRDWSLQQQLSEDQFRYDELRAKKYLDLDLSWRFDELKKIFADLDREMAVNAASMEAAAAAQKTSKPTTSS
jgi:hypothetical protein